MNTLPTLRPLDALARRINEEQFTIEHHANGMLLAAKKAGELLLEAKGQCPHGQFKAWVEAHTNVSYSTAADYMKLARNWEKLGTPNFSGASIRQALALIENAKPAPKTNLPTFTEDDAEYALKIAARLDSDFEGEREVAADKLNAFAKQHGMTGEELVERARAMKPNQDMTETEQEMKKLREELARRDGSTDRPGRNGIGCGRSGMVGLLVRPDLGTSTYIKAETWGPNTTPMVAP